MLNNLIKISLRSGLILVLAGLAAQASVASVRYIPPPDRGTPTSDRGTGSRGDCLYTAELPPLAALVGQSHLTLTVSDRPTLWVYIPYTTAEASQGEVVLQVEATGEEVFRAPFSLNQKPGVTGIRFPESMPALAIGEEYRWYVDIQCFSADILGTTGSTTGNTTSSPATLTGLVKRIALSPELIQDFRVASKLSERLATFGSHHIWYDLLNELAQSRLATNVDPQIEQQTKQLWIDLLSDEAGADLGMYSQEPLLRAVTANFPRE